MPKSTKDADTQSTERRVDMGERGDIIEPTTPGAMEYDYTNFYFGAGSDALAATTIVYSIAPWDSNSETKLATVDAF